MPEPTSAPRAFPADDAVRAEYQAIVDGERRTGPRGNLLFMVSTADLTRGRGDLYVGLGLARGLSKAGWGVSLWPTERMTEETPDDIDVAIVMVESFVPGLVHERTHVIAWVRNWTEAWAELPYLDRYSQIWCSSQASADRMAEVYAGPVHVVPLGTDTELFHPREVDRSEEVATTANYWGVPRGLTEALSSLSRQARVTWFGANSQYLQFDAPIDHRDSIDYFALPWVYSQWTIVVDDVIESAAVYGNQNSRLFDALACGAVVVTNEARGLADLALGDIPVYSDPADLRGIVERILEDPAKTDRTTERLAELVANRHSYDARAASATPLLEQAIAAGAPPERTAVLRWATLQREELRAMETERSDWRTRFFDLQGDSDSARRAVDEIRSSRTYKAGQLVTGPIRAIRRRPG
jgi:glycosyltransferase involved in cell wall biosynthesis